MTRPRAKKRLPRWPNSRWCGFAYAIHNYDIDVTIGTTTYDSGSVRSLHAWLTRWLAAYDARQKRGKT